MNVAEVLESVSAAELSAASGSVREDVLFLGSGTPAAHKWPECPETPERAGSVWQRIRGPPPSS